MCGIAGIVSLTRRPVEPGRIKPMCDVQAHRGPDDAGYAFFRIGEGRTGEGGYWCGFADAKFRHVNEHLPVFDGDYCRDELGKSAFSVALGHRRLAIIDLTHFGHQPMSSSDRRYWITFNGEIYNFPELRRAVASGRPRLSHPQRHRSDPPPLGGARDGLPADVGRHVRLCHLRPRGKRLDARPRSIRREAAVLRRGGRFPCSSPARSRGFWPSGLLRPRISPPALVEYFAFQNTFAPQTLFRDVSLLQPGEFLQLSPRFGGAGRRRAAITPASRFATCRWPTQRGRRRMVADAFREAVARQLVSDVEVGCYLSGGMDSGSIVAVAGRSIPRLLTFTGGFDLTNVNGIEQGFDERKLAEKLSYILQTEHYDVVLHAGDMPAAMEKIAWHMDDPRVGMCHQNWYVAKLASRFVKVCLAGAGGDELFGGYPWRYRQGLAAATREEFDQKYFEYWHRLLPAGEAVAVVRARVVALRPGAAGEFPPACWTSAPPHQPELSMADNLLQRALYFEMKTFLHGFLVTEDRISMAHGLETRVPFLDNRLADLAWRIPPSLKVDVGRMASNGDGHFSSADGKQVLRSAMCR